MRRAPYFVVIAKGTHLGYYRGQKAGTWIGRQYDPVDRRYVTTAIGPANDRLDADGVTVFDFYQAQDAVRSWAEQRRLQLVGAIRSGPYRVSDAVADYLEEIAAEKSDAAVRDATYTLDRHVLPELGRLEVDSLTAARITTWRNGVATLPRRRSREDHRLTDASFDNGDFAENERRKRKATANRVLTMLKAVLNRAFQNQRVGSDRAWRTVRAFKRVDEPTVRYLSSDEVYRLINACPVDFGRMVKAAVLTGCRYSELANLCCSDFNPDSGTVTVRMSKSGKARHVALTEEGLRFFAGITAGRKSSDRMMLRPDGKPWGKSHQKRPLEKASEIARIEPPANFHVLRHTYGSALAMNGAPMRVIADQLGHTSTRITERHYAHLSSGYLAEEVRRALPVFGIADDAFPADIAGRRRKPAA